MYDPPYCSSQDATRKRSSTIRQPHYSGALGTRATKATEEDQNKLQIPFRYVSQSHSANHEVITLHIGDKSADARGWANDAYYAHDDFKTAKSTGSSLSRRDKL